MGKIAAGFAWIIACLVVIIGAVIGWVLNVIHVIGYIGNETTDSLTEVIVRIIGIVVPFVGAIAGYI